MLLCSVWGGVHYLQAHLSVASDHRLHPLRKGLLQDFIFTPSILELTLLANTVKSHRCLSLKEMNFMQFVSSHRSRQPYHSLWTFAKSFWIIG